MICVKCEKEKGEEFYKNDKKCKDCRKKLVRENREKNKEYYKQYDKKRYKEDPRVLARHKKYQKSEAGRSAGNRAKKKWTEKNAIKRGAATMVGNAVRDGKLVKPNNCESCGIKHERLHGHHDDYAKPLDVRWLCPKCHTEWHKENGEGANS